MTSDRISHLILKVSQIFALRCDPALTSRSIPKCDEKSGLFARLDLEDDFVHCFTLRSGEDGSQARFVAMCWPKASLILL